MHLIIQKIKAPTITLLKEGLGIMPKLKFSDSQFKPTSFGTIDMIDVINIKLIAK
jgi:hypothetical protein